MTFNVSNQPYAAQLWPALVLIVLSLIVADRSTIDVHIHDTYFVLSTKFVLRLFAAILILFWFMYLLVGSLMFSAVLTRLHVLLNVLAIASLALATLIVGKYVDFSIWPTGFRGSSRLSAFVTWSGAVLILSQLLFIFNLLAGVTRRAIMAFCRTTYQP